MKLSFLLLLLSSVLILVGCCPIEAKVHQIIEPAKDNSCKVDENRSSEAHARLDNAMNEFQKVPNTKQGYSQNMTYFSGLSDQVLIALNNCNYDDADKNVAAMEAMLKDLQKPDPEVIAKPLVMSEPPIAQEPPVVNETPIVNETPVVKEPIAVAKQPVATKPVTTKSYTVMRGDTLWSISERVYGNPYLWLLIYDNNKNVIGRDPDLIYPGANLVIRDDYSQDDKDNAVDFAKHRGAWSLYDGK